MFGDSSDVLIFDSEPSGAKVYLEDRLLGTTPIKAEILRKSEARYVMIRKEGYKTKTVHLMTAITSSAFLNIGFITTTFGATSWAIDFGSGKMFRYNPLSYVIELESQKGASNQSGNSAGMSPLEFTIVNFNPLRSEFAKGSGSHIQTLCVVYALTPSGCAGFQEQLGSPTSFKT